MSENEEDPWLGYFPINNNKNKERLLDNLGRELLKCDDTFSGYLERKFNYVLSLFSEEEMINCLFSTDINQVNLKWVERQEPYKSIYQIIFKMNRLEVWEFSDGRQKSVMSYLEIESFSETSHKLNKRMEDYLIERLKIVNAYENY